MTTKERFYHFGEEVEYTGKKMVLHGGTFYEYRVVGDSYRIGHIGVTQRAPRVTS